MIWLILIPIGAWLMAYVYFYRAQDRLIYEVDDQIPDMARASVYCGQEITLTPADAPGLKTMSWYWPAKNNRPTILFLHGNNGNIEGRTGWMQFALTAGWGLLMVGYRGYGGNPGTPSQRGLIHDGLCAFDFLAQECKIPGDQIHIFGHSLGSAVATQVAAQRPCGALGLMSPLTAMHHVAFDAYPFLPMGLIVRDQWRSIEKITAINCPLAIVACDRDTTVRFRRSQQLFAAALQPKEFLNIPGIDHGDIALSGGPEYLVDFFDRVSHRGALP